MAFQSCYGGTLFRSVMITHVSNILLYSLAFCIFKFLEPYNDQDTFRRDIIAAVHIGATLGGILLAWDKSFKFLEKWAGLFV